MSQFNKKLDQAKSRQKRFYLVGGIALLAILLLMAALFVVSRGTRVEIIPEDAKESAVIRVTEGLGLSVGDTVYSFARNPVITVTAPGFKVATQNIDPAHLGKVFPLELFELPGRLVIEIIEISGNDENLLKTSWRINNRDIALSEKLDFELEAGPYTVTVDNPYFQPKDVEVLITRGELTQLQVELQPVAGTLRISSKPIGAAFFVDEKNVGLTPLLLEQNGGQYNLRLALENYIDTVEEVAITRADPEVTRNYQLALKKAKLILDLNPKDGTLLVNGIQAVEPLLLDATVEHQLSYMKAGYYSKTQTVTLAAGEEKPISMQLKREMGRVEVVSSPPASVWIDGKDYGVSPVSVNLSAVVHRVIIKKAGYRTVSKKVKPKGGVVQKVSVTLLTEYQARLQEAPREFTNKAGVKLKLYVIRDSLTMGAPRSEKGQRANEFQRKISLTKPFYASLFEITNGQFAKFNQGKATGPGSSPVTSVSWQEAAAFCNWLSAKEKLRAFYKTANGQVTGQVTGYDNHADGYRLLSEGEWEWLARKSGKRKQTMFVWGNETVIPPKTNNVADESAKGQVRFFVPNYNDGYAGVAPVGSFNRESSGLYDMAGNVSEWVHDVYSIVPPSANTTTRNPLGEQRGDAHVVKGANWRSGTITTLRPAFREGLTTARDDVGFRIGRYLYGGTDD
ncbi:MAG: SUMF1/EgtB/PvdO family nonheme iron enzyme [Desulfobulbaceae bacterium]|nr:SUMF1/EgtB/PvdO family nonheme iron enzyme [Desulfobulbaceae bacterium]